MHSALIVFFFCCLALSQLMLVLLISVDSLNTVANCRTSENWAPYDHFMGVLQEGICKSMDARSITQLILLRLMRNM